MAREIKVDVDSDPKTTFEKNHLIMITGTGLRGQVHRLNIDEAYELYRQLYTVCGFKSLKPKDMCKK